MIYIVCLIFRTTITMHTEDRIDLNGMMVFPFCSSSELLRYVDLHKGILVAVNAEKVTKATDETRAIVNNNIGYADGAGYVGRLRRVNLPAEKFFKILSEPVCDPDLLIIRLVTAMGGIR